MAYIKINKQNLYHNLSQLALKAGSIDKIAVVLKDNAYGHDIETISKLCSEYGVSQAVVISNDEKEIAKRYFSHVLVLADKPVAQDGVSYTISDMQTLRELNTNAAIELKVDTGMHRNGISMNEVEEALTIIKKNNINLVGIMTHYKSADEMTSELFWQKKNFEKVKQLIRENGYHKVRFHSHNTAALIRSNLFDEDIARCGIGIYGYSELPSNYVNLDLQPVLSLWATRVSSKRLSKGQRIGYGGCYKLPFDTTVSTYSLGYGDGWPRDDCNRSYSIKEGIEILGKVSMDFISVACDDNEICIMDNAQKAAKHYETISYEMTTCLSSSIERVVV